MLLDYLIRHRERLDPRMAADALEQTRACAVARPSPFPASAAELHAILASELYACLGDGAHRTGPRLSGRPTVSASERARLRVKGRTLHAHCVEQGSIVCVVGFIEHELSKAATGVDVVLDLLGWLAERELDAPDEATRSITCAMRERGVAILFQERAR